MKIVVDTNCLIDVVPTNPQRYWFWDALRDGRFTVCVTTEILEEYEEILSRRYSPALVDAVLRNLLASDHVEYVTIYYHMLLIRHDPDDDKFSDCAFASNAHYLITHDHHFNILRPLFFPRINVVKLKDFKLILQEKK
jgi:putative PIN family toxin of toxin-antitoxin system